MYYVFERSDGRWEYRYQIQDGVESGTAETAVDAVDAVIRGARVMNGTTIAPANVTVYLRKSDFEAGYVKAVPLVVATSSQPEERSRTESF